MPTFCFLLAGTIKCQEPCLICFKDITSPIRNSPKKSYLNWLTSWFLLLIAQLNLCTMYWKLRIHFSLLIFTWTVGYNTKTILTNQRTKNNYEIEITVTLVVANGHTDRQMDISKMILSFKILFLFSRNI